MTQKQRNLDNKAQENPKQQAERGHLHDQPQSKISPNQDLRLRWG
jgi:hypothetical protein